MKSEIKLALIGIALAALLVGSHAAVEHFRDQGRLEVQAEWDADKLQRAESEKLAILNRINANERANEQHALEKKQMKGTYEKEIASVRAVAATAGRLRISTGFCAGFASSVQASGTGGIDAGVATTVVLSEPYAGNIARVMLEADEVVASCRVAQDYLKRTGQAP
jgi:hypothetical protein